MRILSILPLVSFHLNHIVVHVDIQFHESIYTCTAAILHDWKLAWKDRGAITVCGEQGSDIINCLTHAMYAKHLSCMMSYADIGDLKSCRDISRLFLKTILLLLVYVISLVAGTCLS